MKKSFNVAAAVLMAGFFGLPAVAQVASDPPGLAGTASAPSPLVPMRDSIRDVATTPHAAITRTTLRPEENKATIDFEVALKMRNFTELQARVGRHEQIARTEMAAKYHPQATDYAAVVAWLKSQGLTIVTEDASHVAVFGRGTIEQVSRAFQTTFARVTFEGVEYSSAVTAPNLPATISGLVLGVNGLQPQLMMHKHSRRVTAQTPSSEFLPAQIAKVYNADGVTQTGAGEKIAIIMDSFPVSTDLTAFWTAASVSQSLSNIEDVVVTGDPAPAAASEEVSLDVEWSSAMAPGAKVRIYATGDLLFVDTDRAYAQLYADLPTQPALHQASFSYGAGEAYQSHSQLMTDDQYFAEITAEGVTILASAGDGGSNPTSDGKLGGTTTTVESPASSPHVTGVGGTSLTVDSAGAESAEVVWNGSTGATGGGVSGFFPQPSWQTGTGVPTSSMRDVPDIAAVGDPDTGALIILNGVHIQIGGTSWSSPVWAGFCALINQSRAANNMTTLGFLASQVYPLLGTDSFRDITSGNNGTYSAGTGYDSCTGVGVPNVAKLMQALGAPPATPPVVTITSPASNAVINGFTTIAGTATDIGGPGIAGNSINFTLYHVDSAQYWSGSGWSSTPGQISVVVNTTTNVWTYTGQLPSASDGTLLPGQYSLTASTIDNNSVSSTTQAGVNNLFFTVDITPPTVSISAPVAGSVIVSSTYDFNGLANDDQAVSAINLFIRRESDFTYWNGSTWVADASAAILSSTYQSATHSWTSSFSLPLPGGAMDNGNYDFIAIAVDSAGNQTQTDSAVSVNFHPQYTWTHGSLNDLDPNNQNDFWTNPENWSPYGVPPATAVVNISNDTVDATGLAKITLYGLVLGSGGMLNAVEVDLAAGGAMTWSGGASSTFTGTLNIPVGVTADFSGGDKVLGSSSVINNAGTIIWGGSGLIQGYNNSTINNLATGTFRMTADGTVFGNIYGGNAFNNAGLIEKSAGSGTSELDVWSFVSCGTLKADTGILDFDQGLTLNDQSVIAGASLVTASGGNVVMTGTMNIDTVTFEITGSVATSGTATLVSVNQGVVQWTGGQIGGTLNIDPTMIFSIVGSGNVVLGASAILNNAGKIVWFGGGPIQGYNNSTINNLAVGTFQMTADGPLIADVYAGNIFNNAGLFTKIGGTGTTSIDTWTFNNTGTINATSGLIEYDNVLNLNADTAFTGAGAFQFSGTVTAAAGISLSLGNQSVLAGGTLNPADSTNPPTLVGTLGWTTGTINGTWTIPSGTTLNVSGSDPKTLGPSAVLNNSGTINWLGESPIQGYNNSTINNLAGGTFQIMADGAAFVDVYGGNVFNNYGLFVKTSGTGTMYINDWTFNNGGTIRVTSGVMEYDDVLNLNAGTAFTGAGSIRLNGTVTAAAGVSLGDQIVLAGGTFNSADSTNPPHILAGTLSWTSGTMTGTWTIAAGATLNISGSDPKILAASAVLDNFGTVNWLDGAPIQGYNNSTILNEPAASFVVQADGPPLADIYSGNQFTNQGSFIKKVTNGATTLNAWRFDNDAGGVISAQTGSIDFSNELHLNDGGTLLGNAAVANSITTAASVFLTGTTLLDNIDFELLDGALSGDPTAGLDASNGGYFIWSGGSISGSLGLSQRCVTTIAGAGETVLTASSVLNNAGAMGLLSGAAVSGYNNSVLNILAGGSFTIEYGGTLTNSYGGNVLSNAGTLNVGGGMGVFTFSGWSFTQAATGVLNLQIGGAPADSDFDSLQFGETATLDGTLNVSLANNYLPNQGDTFPLLTYSAASGQFATVNAPGFNFSVLYDTSDFSLTAQTQSTIAEWRAAYFADPNSAIAADTFAPAGDNIANLLKYALGLNPYLSGDAGLPVFGTTGVQGNFTPAGLALPPAGGLWSTLSFRRLEPAGVTYIVQASNSLGDPNAWSEIARLTAGQETWTGTASVTETGTGSTRFVVVTDATPLQSVTARFFRLTVSD